MKTGELKKWLDEKGWIYEEDELSIIIHGVLVISKNHKEIELYYRIWSEENGLDLLNKVLEYINTPPSEREDVKRYYIEFNTDNLDVATCYLYKMENGKLGLHDVIKHFFTQSEIDDFPVEIKGAIECGLMRKIRVH